jgi:hypothetical protein
MHLINLEIDDGARGSAPSPSAGRFGPRIFRSPRSRPGLVLFFRYSLRSAPRFAAMAIYCKTSSSRFVSSRCPTDSANPEVISVGNRVRAAATARTVSSIRSDGSFRGLSNTIGGLTALTAAAKPAAGNPGRLPRDHHEILLTKSFSIHKLEWSAD